MQMLGQEDRFIGDSPASNGGRGLKHLYLYLYLAPLLDSPASNGGRGLKQPSAKISRVLGQDSPASNGGRGLKHQLLRLGPGHAAGFARQQWRAWIETRPARARSSSCRGIRPPAMAGVD